MSSDDEAPPPCTAFAGPKPTVRQQVEVDNCFKILLATDNHIGYGETDPVRGRDSINTFREILQLAVENDVDMLLLGGDLFHENKPSRTSLFQTIAALREFTLGSRPVTMQIISDDGIGIARDANWAGINYEDENISVGLPVFSIHGNHDDPQGTGAEGALCALDVLSASGLINYFGRMELPGSATDAAEALETGLHVKPVLLQKGTTKLALYGMGNIRDERFHYEMQSNRMSLFRPAEDPEDWFNVLLVHQNRVPHGFKNYVADTAFGDDAHLIVWGHEHDCIEKAAAVPVTGKKYYITQPGSSVATSLAKGESTPKHVALLKIQDGEFQMEPIRLRSVRPFVWAEIVLSEAVPEPQSRKAGDQNKLVVSRCLKAKVEEMIEQANAEWSELHPDPADEAERMLPLIRLRVDCSGEYSSGKKFEVGNPQRFGQDFINRVANPNDIVQFHSKKTAVRKSKNPIDQPDAADIDNLREDQGRVEISQFVKMYLNSQNLAVLEGGQVTRALEKYIEKGETGAIGALVKKQVKVMTKYLGESCNPGPDADVDDDMAPEMAKVKEGQAERAAAQEKSAGKKKSKDDSSSDSEMDDPVADSDDSMDSADTAASSVKGKGKSKATSKKVAPKKAVAKKAPAKKATLFSKAVSDDSDDSDVEMDEPAPKKVAPKKVGAVKKSKAISISSDSSDDTPVVKKKVAARKK